MWHQFFFSHGQLDANFLCVVCAYGRGQSQWCEQQSGKRTLTMKPNPTSFPKPLSWLLPKNQGRGPGKEVGSGPGFSVKCTLSALPPPQPALGLAASVSAYEPNHFTLLTGGNVCIWSRLIIFGEFIRYISRLPGQTFHATVISSKNPFQNINLLFKKKSNYREKRKQWA